MQTRRSVLAALSGALTLQGFVARADDYPSGPVKILVSFPAGGSIDVVMRSMAAPLQARLGKPVVIENRAGAGGVVAEGAVVKADPDGLTLLADASALAANPTLFKSLPFDTLRDLQPVSLVFRTPLALVVNPEVPVHSVKELIALLKEKPGQINFGHGGPGSAIHLAAELLQIMTGTTMTGIAYRGAPLALTLGTLQAWLTVEGVDLMTIGMFALVGQPYTYKFLWAPLMDRYRLPFLGRRRG